MTVLEQLVVTVTIDPEWAEMIVDQADNAPASPSCNEWSRKGGSHYKDGQFTKK
ncbi:MAG: multiple cyclophane-containing RiPP AmcA [Pseudonocardiaceae bacterium]